MNTHRMIVMKKNVFGIKQNTLSVMLVANLPPFFSSLQKLVNQKTTQNSQGHTKNYSAQDTMSYREGPNPREGPLQVWEVIP